MSRRRQAAVALALAVVAAVVVGCSDDRQPVRAGAPTTVGGVAAPVVVGNVPVMPRSRPSQDPRISVSPDAPLFLYNVYVGDDPTVVDTVVSHWPKDLLPYLGVQVVFPSKPPLPEADREAALDAVLDRTDAAGVPALVQTATFVGLTGPSGEALARAFADHDSLGGISIAEFSADYATSVGGLSPAQKDLIASQLRAAATNRAMFVWADMGYFGPQVFIDAGADPQLMALFAEQSDRIIIQAKQNGAGRHFGTASAASGLWQAGLARGWGINIEDWLWWESSFERRFAPQLAGGLTAAGMTRSASPNRSRLTYPEALFGTEILMAAASGASLFSIEAPARGTVDADHDVVSPAGEQVVFPLLRRLVARRVIPAPDELVARTPFALVPASRDTAALATDAVYDALGGPDGCRDDDRIVCTQRQWLWRPGAPAIVPTIPVLSGERRMRFPEAIDIDGADTVAAVAARAAELWPDQRRDAERDGDRPAAWTSATADPATWFAANPEENRDVVAEFALERVSGELGPHTFAVVTDGATPGLVDVLVDNFSTDTTALWDSAQPDEELGGLRLDTVPADPPGETMLRFRGVEPGAKVRVEGGVEHRETRDGDVLTVTLRHRGPVTVTVGP